MLTSCGRRVLELSQNVDRFTDTTPFGATSCITPTGIPYLTTRGGPVIGYESLALQGLPIDKLLLTRETQRELQDLAGNAMSSTVVGVALFGALMVGHEAFMPASEEALRKAASRRPEVSEMDCGALNRGHILDFGASKYVAIDELRGMAESSVGLCYCEGQTFLSTAPIQICMECSHTTCTKCGGNPRHKYQAMEHGQHRTYPRIFIRTVKNALPMRLRITDFDFNFLKTSRTYLKGSLTDAVWTSFVKGIGQAVGEELRFQTVKRTHCWTVVYDAPSSRLELAFASKVATWSLFAKPYHADPVNSTIREIFKYPFARMTVEGPDIFTGQWKIRLPTVSTFRVTISGVGDLIRSWESQLGIQSPREADKKVFPGLKVSLEDPGSVPTAAMIIEGEYKLLQNCGTASGSLHKKIARTFSDDDPALYLFLDPERIGNPEYDQFVFSTTKHRMAYQEVRQPVACLEASWRPSDEPSSNKSCSMHGAWFNCDITLQALQASESAIFTVPNKTISISIAQGISTAPTAGDSCSGRVTAILSCEVPLDRAETGHWQPGPWSAVDLTGERQVLSSFAWLTERARSLCGFANKWIELELPDVFTSCANCCPGRPKIEWEVKTVGKRTIFVPYEDRKQAADFEHCLKNRPPPFTTHVRVDEDTRGRLMIGLNVPTMAHRALARFEGLRCNDGSQLFWRVVTQEGPSSLSLPKFKLGNNKGGQQAKHKFAKGNPKDPESKTGSTEELRPEQKRSLRWMIDQEADEAPSFKEQEIEEATLPQLAWRAEARVMRSRNIKGGVLADQVGYGKTATTLALIDSQMEKAVALSQIPRPGSIPLKATLIIVPFTLLRQWNGQVQKFLGSRYNVVSIPTMVALNKMPVGRLQHADIVIVAWSLFKGDAYLKKLSRMAALPECPSKTGRVFEAWLSMACQRVADHTNKLKGCSIEEFAQYLEQKAEATKKDKKISKYLPSKRFRGKEYVKNAAKATGAKNDGPHENDNTKAPEVPEVDVFGLEKADSLTSIVSPPLHMFHFARVVVDEYTYMKGTEYSVIASLKASSRWVLSGTPPLDDFADVKTLAGLIGINLGSDDDATGILKRQSINAIRKGRTGR